MGDIKGSIQDLEHFITWNTQQKHCPEAKVIERNSWIQKLRIGTIPFTNTLINDLRIREPNHKTKL